MQELVIIRGLPGSGKTTYAKKYYPYHVHLEADMFFGDPYCFDSTKIKQAHQWCQEKTLEAVENKHNVVVSNTFIKKWEMSFYENLAKERGMKLTVKTMKGNYKNTHGVPESVIERMRTTFEE